jgi:hypothetical protein
MQLRLLIVQKPVGEVARLATRLGADSPDCPELVPLVPCPLVAPLAPPEVDCFRVEPVAPPAAPRFRVEPLFPAAWPTSFPPPLWLPS